MARGISLKLLILGLGIAACGEQVLVTEVAADCGNGKLEYGEDCDDGNEVATDDCTNDCRIARCGDAVTRAVDTPDAPEAEECDDGDTNRTG